MAQFDAGRNMTDVLAALTVLVDIDCPERDDALDRVLPALGRRSLVVDKWFALQARSSLPRHDRAGARADRGTRPSTRKNPNRVRALVGTFAQANQLRFHDASGAGYVLLADEVIALDPLNPTTAARLVQPLGSWRRHDAARQGLMRRELDRVLAAPGSARTPMRWSRRASDAGG